MKKIIATLSFVLAFTIGANAQNKKVSNEELAKNDAVALVDYLGLNNQQSQDFNQLFLMKQEILNNPDASQERKDEMIRIIGLKIEASIDSKQLEKLKSNAALYSKLTGTPVLAPASKKK